MGPKNLIYAAISRNNNPGPGTHEFVGLHTHTFNKVLRGELEAEVRNDKSIAVIDNGVPGAGTYNSN